MKKLIALALTLILLTEAIPFAAIAEGSAGLLSANEANAALALAGYEDNAASWHEGMKANELQSGRQIAEFLRDILDDEIQMLETGYHTIENELALLKEKDPAGYASLTAGENAGMPDYVHTLERSMTSDMMQVEYWLGRIEYLTAEIRSSTERLAQEAEDLTDYEQRLLSRNIRDAEEEIRQIRTEVQADGDALREQLGQRVRQLAGQETSANEPEAGRLAGWADQVLEYRDAVLVSQQINTATLFPGRNTLLAGLSPISTAEAESNSQQGSVFVVTDKQVAFVCRDENDRPIEGVTVTVSDLVNRDYPKTFTGKTNEFGAMTFPVAGFGQIFDKLYIQAAISKRGYRQVVEQLKYVEKGKIFHITMVPDTDNQPYIAGCTFDGRECLWNEYETVYSGLNDRGVSVIARVINPSDKPVMVHVVYQSEDGNQYWHTMGHIIDESLESYSHVIEPHSTGIMIANGRWRQRLKPGGDYFTMNIDGKDVPEKGSKGTKGCLRLVLTDAGKISEDFTKGSPALQTGHYTIYNCGLKVRAAKIQAPIAGAGALSNLISGFAGGGLSFPTNKGSIWAQTGSIGLKLPVEKYIPKVSVALDLSTVFVVGFMDTNFLSDKGPIKQWKSTDLDDIKANLTADEKKNFITKNVNTFKKAKARAGKGGMKMGRTSGELAMYAGGAYQVKYDQKTGNWVSREVSGAFGIALTFYMERSYPVVGPLGIPFTFGYSFSASATVGFQVGGVVSVNANVPLDETTLSRTIDYSPVFGNFALNIRAILTGYVGVGIKGIISVTLNAYCYINLLLMAATGGGTSKGGFTLRLSAGAGIYFLAEILFVTYRQEIVTTPDWTLYDGYWPQPNSAAGKTFSSLFLSEAKAEEEVPESPTLHATDYPNLVPESTKVFGPMTTAAGSHTEVMTINGHPFAFILQSVEVEYIRKKLVRVMWINLENGSTGWFSGIRTWDDSYMDYRDDVSFHVSELDPQYYDYTKQPTTWNDPNYGKTIYAVTGVRAKTTVSGNDISVERWPYMYTFLFTSDGKGGLTTDLRKPDAVNRVLFKEWNNLVWYQKVTTTRMDELKDLMVCSLHSSTCVEGKPLVMRDTSTVLYGFEAAASSGNFVYHLKGDITGLVRKKLFIERIGERPVATLDGGNYSNVIGPYYYIENGGAGQQIKLINKRHNTDHKALAEAKSIPYYLVVPRVDERGDLLFYVTQDEQAGETLNHLYSAEIRRYEDISEENTQYVFTDLDMVIPAATFQVTEFGATMYIHWLQSMADLNDKTRTRYQVMAVVYDQTTGIVSDKLVLAQFSAPADQSISHLVLTDQGVGYYSMGKNGKTAGDAGESTVYSFPLELITSLELRAIALEKDVVKQGDNLLVCADLVNTGNVAISGFTLTETTSNALVETVTCDILHPENNRLHMEGDNPKNDITGPKVIWNDPLAPGTMNQKYWEVKKRIRTYKSRTQEFTEETKTFQLKAVEILPGEVACYTTLTKIPSNWEGKKQIIFDLSKLSASANQLQNMYVRSMPEAANLLTEADVDVSYTVGKDGKMHLDAANRLTAGNGLAFANELPKPESVILENKLDNIAVQHRIRLKPDGTRMLDITIINDTVDQDTIRLYCEVYLDDSETPYYLDLPYSPEYMASAATHTIEIPVSMLANGTNAQKAWVVIRGIGIEETALLDNSFEVELREGDPLRIVVQPQNRTAKPGETVTLTVQAAGGNPPYSYQWQVYMGESLGWRNIDGATGSTLTLENVTLGMNGWKYRCIVKDLSLDQVISEEAVLTVRKIPRTGDDSQTLLLFLMAAVLLAAGFYIRSRQKRKER